MATKAEAATIRPGDVILPPERELPWMRRHAGGLGLPESALYLTVRKVCNGMPDKRGPWLVIVTDRTEAWNAGRKPRPFVFQARPETLWPIISRKPYVIDGFTIPVVDPEPNALTRR